MKKERIIPGVYGHVLAWMACAFLFVACGDDDSFSPVSKNRGYDYAYTSAEGLSKTPCNEMREGREAVIGRDKDQYECLFDRIDSVYIWVGYDDTLTAEGRVFHRAESSSSEESGSSSSSRYSSSYSSSSYSSSSSSSSSRAYSSSSDDLYDTKKYGGYVKDSYSFAKISREDLLNPDIDYGTLIDERDGQVYKTVVIGNRIWMAENLNFAGNDDFPYVEDESVCYNYDEANCALLGRLYSRVAAMNSSSCALARYCDIGDTAIRGVCPKGWHIPSYAEAVDLQAFFSSLITEARSAETWEIGRSGEGINSSGFSMPASGCLDVGDEDFENGGEVGYVWFYTQSPKMEYLIFKTNHLDIHTGYDYDILISVRCVSDDTLNVASSSSSARSSSSVSSSSVSSSSSSLGMAFSSMAIPFVIESKNDIFNPEVEYGTLTDERDGQTYKTVNIDGKVWMAENLNFAGNDGYPILKEHSYCFNNVESNCAMLGRLYDRPAAMNDMSCDFGENCDLNKTIVRGVCPEGWHIPTKTEASNLLDFFGTNYPSARSAEGWGTGYAGTNTSGFSIVGSGNLSVYKFVHAGELAMIWFYTTGVDLQYIIHSAKGSSFYMITYGTDRQYISVRCVQD